MTPERPGVPPSLWRGVTVAVALSLPIWYALCRLARWII